MNEGQQPGLVSRMRLRSALPSALQPVNQAAEIIHHYTNLGTPSVVREIVPSALRRLFGVHWHAKVNSAIAEEQAFGHAFLFIPVFLGLGALIWFSLQETPGFLKLALLMCVLGIAAFILRYASAGWRILSLFAALVLAGMVLAAVETARMNTVLLDTPVTTLVRGTVTARETTDKGYWRYTVIVSQTSDPILKRPPRKVTLLSRSRAAPVPIGDGIEGKARLSPPSGAALLGLNDFAFDSYFKGIGAVGYFYGRPDAVSDQQASASSSMANFLTGAKETIARWREAIGARIRGTIGGDAGAIAAALVTAEERAISKPTIEALREAGLAHVLAISGLNMVLAAGTFLIGARTALSLVPGFAQRFPIKKLAAGGALAMVFCYILISGGAVSAVRSWIMISIMLVAVFFDRPSISLRNVALSALVILVITPSAVTGPGFQMSFAATLALVAGYSHWRERPGGEQPSVHPKIRIAKAVGGFFAGLLLSSLIGGLSTMIYSAGHFHRLAAYGLVGNVLAMPIISIFVMPFALIAMLLMPFGLDRLPLLVMGQGLDWMISIATMVASWGGQITTGRVSDAAFMLIAGGGVLACLFRTWLAIPGLLVIAVGLFVGWTGAVARPDIAISEDGRMIALIDGDISATNRAKPPDFIFSQWQRGLRLKEARKPLQRADLTIPDVETPQVEAVRVQGDGRTARPAIDKDAARVALRRIFAETKTGRFACVPKQWCAATSKQGWRIAAVEDIRFVGIACEQADLVVTPAMLRFQTCRSGATLLSGQSLRRSGAIEIHAEPAPGEKRNAGLSAMRLISALDQLNRPWSLHRTYDWRTGKFDAPSTE